MDKGIFGQRRGKLYWTRRLDRTNGNLNEIIEAFANAIESQALYGSITSNNIVTIMICK